MTGRLHCGDRVVWSHRGGPFGTVATYRIVEGIKLVRVRLDDTQPICRCSACTPGALLEEQPARNFRPIPSSPSSPAAGSGHVSAKAG